MSSLCRHTIRVMILTMLILGVCSAAMAFTIQFAPFEPPPNEVEVFEPSTSVPVAPQLFRFTIVRQQAIIGAEEPYVRTIEPVSPIRFNMRKLSRETPQPISHTPKLQPRRRLRGPETFLLRRTQTVADQVPQ